MGSVTKAKWHEEELVEAKRSDYSSFGNIRRMNWDLMIALHQIQLGEDSGTMEAGRVVLEIGKGIAVRNSGDVKAVINATRQPGTIWFGDKMERRGPGTVGMTNNTRLLQFIKLLLGLLEASGIKTVGFSKNRRTSGFNMMKDFMFGGMTMEINGENCGIVSKELTNGGRVEVKMR